MKSPAAAMRWELWQKNRWAFIFLGGLFYLCIGWILILRFFYGIGEYANQNSGEMIGVFGLALTWLALFAVFGYADNDPRKGFSGFPARMFLLPVRTRTLVQWPVLYGIGAIVFCTIAWTLFVFWPMNIHPSMGYLLLLASTAMVTFQALVWGLASFPKTRIAALLLWGFGLIVMAMGLASDERGLMEWLLACVLVVGLLGIEYGMKAERSGGWQGWHGWQRWFNPWVVWRRNSAAPFRSPLQAQLWIEWRRNGRLFLAILTGTAAIECFYAIVWVKDGGTVSGWFGSDQWGLLAMLVVLACVLGGLMVPNDPATGRYAMSPFIAVRPVATADMFRVKFKVAIRAFLRVLPLLAILGILWMIASKTPLSTLYPWRSSEDVVVWPKFFRGVVLAAAWVLVPYSLLLGALQVWLAGRTPGLPWSFVLLLLAVMAAFIMGAWFLQADNAMDTWASTARTAALGLALLLKMGFAYFGFHESYRRALMSGRFMAGYVAIWLLVSVLLLVLSDKVSNELEPVGILSWLLILIFPLGRVGWSPLALAWNRHR